MLGFSFAPDKYVSELAPPIFIERDPDLSNLLVHPETVPVGMLLSITALVPLAVIAIGHTFYNCKARLGFGGCFKSFWWIVLALFQCIVICAVITNTLKVAARRPRPNFFAYCNYKGAYQAQLTGNYTAYNAATSLGTFGSIADCQGSIAAWTVQDAFKSFPSGHSSFSMASMLFTSFYLAQCLNVNWPSVSFRGLISFSPLVIACYVCISRWVDRFHHTDDILCGALIGMFSASVAWKHFMANKRLELTPEAEKKDAAAAGLVSGGKYTPPAAAAAPLTGNAASYA